MTDSPGGPLSRLVAFLERGNGGVRTLLQLGGLAISLVVIIFTLGGIWKDLRDSVKENSEQNREMLLEMKLLRKDMVDIKSEAGLNSYFRLEHPKDHEAEGKRIDRLERIQDRRP